jgi:hypothetical protein
VSVIYWRQLVPWWQARCTLQQAIGMCHYGYVLLQLCCVRYAVSLAAEIPPYISRLAKKPQIGYFEIVIADDLLLENIKDFG